MNKKAIASELFSAGNKYYFFDFMRAVNQTHYIRITRSDELPGKKFRRSSVIIFEEDIEPFIQALSSLLHHAAYSENVDDSLDMDV